MLTNYLLSIFLQKQVRCLFLIVIFCLLSSNINAQLSADPLVNLKVGFGAESQFQAKICPCSDGGCYISWYDEGSSYDVRLQRLDADGYEKWASNGIIVADLNLSWVQDYGMDG